MSPVITYFLSPLARLLLWLFDWQPITDDFEQEFLNQPRKVIIFPHTTKWDFPILAAYALTRWSIYRSRVYLVMKPQLANGPFARFFKLFNCLAATRREEPGGGFIARTVDQFKDEPTFSIIMAPEGTVARNEWRTGYFNLAKSLNCPIQVMGLDYHQRCVVMKIPVLPIILESTERQLKEVMATIPTLYPENSVVPSPRVATSLYGKKHLIESAVWIGVACGLLCGQTRSIFLVAISLSILHLAN